ncbi:hypothetical protein [Virgibacillus proomii]|uniref:hypothetical protein n=1 Tax=Virgibacillus proomii TaxID=84407 RepID=UPI001C0FD970|nr:hypothetical protein [Virgibacillus proomii]MBU5266973.1 hypothetical protein [Virgibacillus proomii]
MFLPSSVASPGWPSSFGFSGFSGFSGSIISPSTVRKFQMLERVLPPNLSVAIVYQKYSWFGSKLFHTTEAFLPLGTLFTVSIFSSVYTLTSM